VSSGTIPSVKINGKEAAVLNSMVKTCTDPAPAENCKIVAVGSSVKPAIEIPETKPIDRSLSNPKWEKAKAGVGEKVKLSVQLKNQYENATVKYKVFPEKGNPEKDEPLQILYGRNIGGKSDVTWKYEYIHDPEKPLKEKPKFIFTAESFGCEKVKSGAVEFGVEIDIKCIDIFGENIKDTEYSMQQSGEKAKTDGEGKISKKDAIPGDGILLVYPE
jgi:hypothetical protein